MKLSYDELDEVRHQVIDDLIALARAAMHEDADHALLARTLKVSERQVRAAIEVNASLRHAPVMPAIERYTGVLFDALNQSSLPEDAQTWVLEHVVIHSAAFGLVAAGDRIPNYRCSHNSRFGDTTLKRRWGETISQVLAEHDGVLLDARSKAYAELGPAPQHERSVWLDVGERLPDGSFRSLSHFNKAAKGRLVRRLAQRLASQPEPQSVPELAELTAPEFDWEARDAGVYRLTVAAE